MFMFKTFSFITFETLNEFTFSVLFSFKGIQGEKVEGEIVVMCWGLKC